MASGGVVNGVVEIWMFHASRDQQDAKAGTWIFYKRLKVLGCLLEDLSDMLVAFNLIAPLCMIHRYWAPSPTTYLKC